MAIKKVITALACQRGFGLAVFQIGRKRQRLIPIQDPKGIVVK